MHDRVPSQNGKPSKKSPEIFTPRSGGSAEVAVQTKKTGFGTNPWFLKALRKYIVSKIAIYL